MGEILSRERKYIALVWAVKSLSTYLIGREFVAETDHAPLLYLNSAKSRMAAYEYYEFSVRSVRGSGNYRRNRTSRSILFF